nr:spidroin-1-like [Aegilops tauschii subsp. strangulata]
MWIWIGPELGRRGSPELPETGERRHRRGGLEEDAGDEEGRGCRRGRGGGGSAAPEEDGSGAQDGGRGGAGAEGRRRGGRPRGGGARAGRRAPWAAGGVGYGAVTWRSAVGCGWRRVFVRPAADTSDGTEERARVSGIRNISRRGR